MKANEPQSKRVKQVEKAKRSQELLDLGSVLSHPEGRRLLWRILEECKTFSSVMTGNSWTHYYAGKQDLGHYLMSEITEANEDALFVMMKENKIKGENNNVGQSRSAAPR